MANKKDLIYEQAYATVLRIRGGSDAPGFDACVEAEIRDLIRQKEEANLRFMQRKEKF